MTNSMNSPHNPYGARPSEANPYGAQQSGSHQWRESGSSGLNAEDFNAHVRTIWATRPVRLPSEQNSNAWFFGVAEGIGVRYNIDANLVRLFFAVLALSGGGGFLLYALCMLLMPKYSMPLSPFEAVLNNTKDPRYSAEKDWAYVLLVIMAVSLFGAGWIAEGWGLVGLAVGALLLWLLHQRQPKIPPALRWHPYPGSPVDFDGDASEDAESDASRGEAQPNQAYPVFTSVEGFEPKRQTPPSWDPLGTAPFAWDLPDPDEVLGADGQRDSASRKARDRKRSTAPLGKRLVMGAVSIVFTIIAMVTAMAAFGLVSAQNDSSTSVVGSSDVVHLNDADKAQTVLTASSATVSLDELTVTGDSRHDLKAYVSTIEVKVPERTNGKSYRLTINCANTFLASADCEAARNIVIKGNDWSPELAKKENELPTFTLNTRAVLSTLHVSKQ